MSPSTHPYQLLPRTAPTSIFKLSQPILHNAHQTWLSPPTSPPKAPFRPPHTAFNAASPATSPLPRYDPCPTPGDEKRLLDMVEDMYRAGLLPDAVEVVQQDTGAGCTAEHMDLVLLAVFHHFRRHHRWAAALKFFERLQEAWAPAAVYVAAAQRELDSFEGSFATLSGALERAPSSPALLVALANECMYAGQVEMAAKLARRAIRVRHTLRPAWLLLSRCYARLGLYTLSLITLNVVPPPPAPAPELVGGWVAWWLGGGGDEQEGCCQHASPHRHSGGAMSVKERERRGRLGQM